jgi:site-specific recombinase XerC
MQKEWTISPEQFLTKEEAQGLRRVVQDAKDLALLRGSHRHYIKDYFLIAVFLETGLRLFELRSLKPQDLLLSRHQPCLIVRCGKGGKSRVVHLTGTGKSVLAELLQLKRQWNESMEFLFISQQGRPYSCRGIQKRVLLWLSRAGLNTEALSTHSLRHTYLTELLRKTKNLNLVKHQAGHSSLSVSSRYLHCSVPANRRQFS